ncbi:MAG: hypothetical protein HWE10_11580 [Gammaproteobacteria bacterium]|nr:hypothetical protein [Gammaproteobacteria bacterium]
MNKLFTLLKHNNWLIFLSLFITLQAAYILGINKSTQYNNQQVAAAIKNKIQQDAHVLSYVLLQGTEYAEFSFLNDYINQLNQELSQQQAKLKISSISPQVINNSALPIQLKDQTLGYVHLQQDTPTLSNYLGIWPLLASLVMTWLLNAFTPKTNFKQQPPEPEVTVDVPDVWLQIDLKEKKIRNVISGTEVYVANKPLCFYCALVDFCIDNPETFLNPNKELPPEFLALANKYFSRLMDLGHTIRKRPNFSNNVEKTLSEIRAAIDEIFPNDLSKKAIFSPPKAIGEGSRSKAHNVNLQQLELGKITFIGK